MSSLSSKDSQKYWWEEERDVSAVPLPSGRIHVLGLGAIGCLLAHGLVSLPESRRPPVTLLLHRSGLWEDFKARDQQITLIRNADGVADRKGGFDVDVLTSSSSDTPTTQQPSRWEAVARQQHQQSFSERSESNDEITTLIFLTKAAATIPAIRSVRHRLTSSSTILFIQNGMGQLDELNDQVFPDPSVRPNYMQGIISHGLYLKEPFMPVHAGMGNLTIGMVPRPSPTSSSSPDQTKPSAENSHWPPTARSLYLTLSHPHSQNHLNMPRSPLPYPALLTTQLLKLATNAVNNTLTPLLDILVGRQLTNPFISDSIIPDLVAEISAVILALPELNTPTTPASTATDVSGGKTLIDRTPFHPSALEPLVREILYVNRNNSSSTREDVNRARETELDYICGYLIRRGAENGVDAKWLRLLLALVKARGLEVREARGGGR